MMQKKKKRISVVVFFYGAGLRVALVLLSGCTYVFLDNYLSAIRSISCERVGQFG